MQSIHSTLSDSFGYLYARWQDEKEYEDFADYIAHMTKKMPDGATLTKMTKRPFRVEYTMPDGARRWILANSREVRWGGYAVTAEA